MGRGIPLRISKSPELSFSKNSAKISGNAIPEATALDRRERSDRSAFIQVLDGSRGPFWVGAVFGAVADIDCSDCSKKN